MKTVRSKIPFNRVREALLAYAKSLPKHIRIEGMDGNKTVDVMFYNGTIRVEIQESGQASFSRDIGRITPKDYHDGNVLKVDSNREGSADRVLEFIEKLCKEEQIEKIPKIPKDLPLIKCKECITRGCDHRGTDKEVPYCPDHKRKGRVSDDDLLAD